MFKVRNYSISQKLTWMNMLVSGAALLLACAAFAAYELEDFRATMVRSLSIQAQIVGANSASALLFNDPATARTNLSALDAAPHIRSAGIYTPDGQLFASWLQDPGDKLAVAGVIMTRRRTDRVLAVHVERTDPRARDRFPGQADWRSPDRFRPGRGERPAGAVRGHCGRRARHVADGGADILHDLSTNNRAADRSTGRNRKDRFARKEVFGARAVARNAG